MPACCTQDNFTGNLSRLEPFNDKRLITGGGKSRIGPSHRSVIALAVLLNFSEEPPSCHVYDEIFCHIN